MINELINQSSEALVGTRFAVVRDAGHSTQPPIALRESGALKSPTLLDSIIRAKEALCRNSNPVTGEMAVEDIRAWWDLAFLQDELLGR